MNILFGTQGTLNGQKALDNTQTTRLNSLAEVAGQISDTEHSSSQPNQDQFHHSERKQLGSGKKSSFHPYKREAVNANNPSDLNQSRIQAPAQAIEKQFLNRLKLLKAILQTRNPVDRNQMFETLLNAEKSTPPDASGLVLAALLGNVTDIKAKLADPAFSLKGPNILKTIVASNHAKDLGHSAVVKAIAEHPKVINALANINTSRG